MVLRKIQVMFHFEKTSEAKLIKIPSPYHMEKTFVLFNNAHYKYIGTQNQMHNDRVYHEYAQ